MTLNFSSFPVLVQSSFTSDSLPACFSHSCYQEAMLNSILFYPQLSKLSQALTWFWSAPCWHAFLLTEVLVLPGYHSHLVPKKQTDVYINHKLIGLSAQASYLFFLTSYTNPSFLSLLAMWLRTFLARLSQLACSVSSFLWSEWQMQTETTHFPENSLSYLYFLPGCPAHTSCLTIGQSAFV